MTGQLSPLEYVGAVVVSAWVAIIIVAGLVWFANRPTGDDREFDRIVDAEYRRTKRRTDLIHPQHPKGNP